MEIRPFIIFINLGGVLKIFPASHLQLTGLRLTQGSKPGQPLLLTMAQYIENGINCEEQVGDFKPD